MIMRLWKDADANTAMALFRSDADAELFSRAATELWGWHLIPAGEDDGLPFPVFFDHRQIFFPIASFADVDAQFLASALFAWFDRASRYPATRGLGCYAPLQMTTKTFLEESRESPCRCRCLPRHPVRRNHLRTLWRARRPLLR